MNSPQNCENSYEKISDEYSKVAKLAMDNIDFLKKTTKNSAEYDNIISIIRSKYDTMCSLNSIMIELEESNTELSKFSLLRSQTHCVYDLIIGKYTY